MNMQGELNFAPFDEKRVMRPKRATESRPGPPRSARGDRTQPPPTAQASLNFGLEGQQGYSQWLAQRRLAAQEMMHRLHLPLGHPVEVWLSSGIRLRGTLRLAEEVLFIEDDRIRHLELVVDDVGFTYREMESCVRLD